MKGAVRDRTWERHEQVVRLHLEPTIGGVRLDRLNTLQEVQAVYGRKLDAGLSPRSVEIVHATLHKALKQAVGWTLIPRNVAAATPPRPVRKDITPLSREQARVLLEAARGDRLYVFYVLAVTTGMRNGELLGLQWRDVDLDANTLQVRRTVFNSARSGAHRHIHDYRDRGAEISPLRHRPPHKPHPRLRSSYHDAGPRLPRWCCLLVVRLPFTHGSGIAALHRRLHAGHSRAVQPAVRAHPVVHRPPFLPQQVRRQKVPRNLLGQAKRRDGPRLAGQRPRRGGAEGHAGLARLGIAAPRCGF